jgi:hypothetical protein
MPDRHYNSDEGEFVDFATLEDWENPRQIPYTGTQPKG